MIIRKCLHTFDPNICIKFSVKVSFPKLKIVPPQENSGVVYTVPCSDWPGVYVGKISQLLQKRISQPWFEWERKVWNFQKICRPTKDAFSLFSAIEISHLKHYHLTGLGLIDFNKRLLYFFIPKAVTVNCESFLKIIWKFQEHDWILVFLDIVTCLDFR